MMKKYIILSAFLMCLIISFTVYYVPKYAVKGSDNIDSYNYKEILAAIGEYDSFFEDYEVYFDKGVSIKHKETAQTDENGNKGYSYIRNGEVENILLNEKYTANIADDIAMGAASEYVIKKLGSPDFKDSETELIGYKKDKFYIFFVGDKSVREISIYPVNKENTDVVHEVLEACSQKSYSRELAGDIAESFQKAWNGYNYSYDLNFDDRYSDRGSGIGAAYYDKGIMLNYHDNSSDQPILNVYSNYGGDPFNDIVDADGRVIAHYNENIDLIFEQEKIRLENQKALENRIITEGKVSPDGKLIMADNNSHNGIDIIYANHEKPSYCILTSPLQYDSGEWIDERYIIYRNGSSGFHVHDIQKNVFANIPVTGYTEVDISDGSVILSNDSGESTVINYHYDSDDQIVLSLDNGENIGDNIWQNGKLASAEVNILK